MNTTNDKNKNNNTQNKNKKNKKISMSKEGGERGAKIRSKVGERVRGG